jgi:thiol-disulfide isomerase/thioredoxin
MMRAVVITALLVTLAAGGFSLSAQAPPLALKNLWGRTRRLSDYRGKVVLINFWATWCPPCRAEIPELVKWQREYRDHGLQIIGVTYPPPRAAQVRQFMRRLKVNYPVALGTRETKALFKDPTRLRAGDEFPVRRLKNGSPLTGFSLGVI